MKNKDYLWYASYGSNIAMERFLCYIKGGKPEGSQTNYSGCDDKSEPKEDKTIIIGRELYFAKKSKSWNGGGVCFLEAEPKKGAHTLGRMYLITRQQFIDVVKQEMDYEGELEINFSKVAASGNLIIKPNSWYGNIIYLGEQEGFPIFTFTNESDLEDINPPDEAYLRTIIKGIKEIYSLSDFEIAKYFENKRGFNQ